MKQKITLALVMTLALFVATERREVRQNEGYIRARVIRLEGEGGACSGVQVHSPSGANYILTAAHCEVIADSHNNIYASIEDSRPIPRKILEVSDKSDLMLLEGMPDLKGVDLATDSPIHESYSAFTHGARQPTHRADGEYLGVQSIQLLKGYVTSPEDEAACTKDPRQKVVQGMYCVLEISEMASTIKVEPGSSGGPIVDKSMHLVGIVSAGNIAFSYHVPLTDIQAFLSPY